MNNDNKITLRINEQVSDISVCVFLYYLRRILVIFQLQTANSVFCFTRISILGALYYYYFMSTIYSISDFSFMSTIYSISDFSFSFCFPFSSHSLSESREKAISRAERLRTSAVVVHGGSTEGMKMLCGLCQNLLRRKPYSVDSTQSSSGNLSVVAVLVCSHVYHADCLEQRTTYQDRRDPPCPLCAGSPSNVDA